MDIKIGGVYKHFKGKLYKVISAARDSETLEEMVVYQALYDSEEFGKKSVWVRPKKMFLEIIEKDGKTIKRFELVE